MLSTSFSSEEKLTRFLNSKDKMEFIRCYTDLLDRWSYLKLKQVQWDYYLQIGQTQNIWASRALKRSAEKTSIAHVYGRSKSTIGQRRIQIEQQMLFQSVPNVDYSSELNSLSSIVRTFAHENQQQLRNELEYKRQMLILDATDHRFIPAFFDLKPKMGQVSIQWVHFFSLNSILDIVVFVLDPFSQVYLANGGQANHGRRRSGLLGTVSTLFDRMIDEIDVMEQTSPTEWERMKQLKKDIIHRCIITGRGVAENCYKAVVCEKEKYFVKRNVDESTSEWQVIVINTIESRRLQMIERAAHRAQFKLASNFQDN